MRCLCYLTTALLALLLFVSSAWTQEKQKDKEPPVPDLQALLAKPQSEMRIVVQRYEADRGSLQRLYTIPASPARVARLSRFNQQWQAALKSVDAGKLSPPAQADLKKLEASVQSDLVQLDQQKANQASVVALLPLAATIIELEESRRRLERVNSMQAAGELVALKKQVDQLVQASELPATKEQVTKAGEALTSLRGTLKNWFNFHNGYDPVFTWWIADPYKDADAALGRYAAFLKDVKLAEPKPRQKGPVVALPSPPGDLLQPARTNDVPDLRALLALERSEMVPILQRFQADRGGKGKLAGAGIPIPGGRTPERIAALKKSNNDWLAALAKLDFAKLSVEGKVDYLLLRNQIQRDLARLDLPVKGPKQEDEEEELLVLQKKGGEKVVRPIGREALLVDLKYEMIPYTPEELVAIAEKEFAWCEAQMKIAARDMGFGDDWQKALEKVKTLHVEPGRQPELIRDLAREAQTYLDKHDLVTVAPIARETWRMEMMSPQRQLVNPFFTGGEVISVSFPTNTMPYEAKLQSLRGNNVHFSRATVHHELIPGHHLQGFMNARFNSHRRPFITPFWTEGWALYWELLLYERNFPRTPEDKVGFLFWRMHRCARINFSLSYHLGKMNPEQCVDYLVTRVGHERANATAEVRRSFNGSYPPLYQAAYLLGGMQIRSLRQDLVGTGKMTDRAFHDAILQGSNMPIEMVRARLTGQGLTAEFQSGWRFRAKT